MDSEVPYILVWSLLSSSILYILVLFLVLFIQSLYTHTTQSTRVAFSTDTLSSLPPSAPCYNSMYDL